MLTQKLMEWKFSGSDNMGLQTFLSLMWMSIVWSIRYAEVLYANYQNWALPNYHLYCCFGCLWLSYAYVDNQSSVFDMFYSSNKEFTGVLELIFTQIHKLE